MKHLIFKIFAASLVLGGSISAWAQSCQSKDEIAEPARKAVETAAQQAFDQSARGDIQGLQTGAIPSLQSNFSGIASAVNDNKDAFPGAKPQIRNIYLLDTGSNPGPDGVFYCGVFGATGMTPSTAEFDIPGLPVGKYAVVIQDFVGNKGPYAMTTISRTPAAGSSPDTISGRALPSVMTVCGICSRHAITKAKVRPTTPGFIISNRGSCLLRSHS